MGNLVAQVSEQRSEGLTQRDTPSFALSIICLRNVDCDYAFVVASHHGWPPGGSLRKQKRNGGRFHSGAPSVGSLSRRRV